MIGSLRKYWKTSQSVSLFTMDVEIVDQCLNKGLCCRHCLCFLFSSLMKCLKGFKWSGITLLLGKPHLHSFLVVLHHVPRTLPFCRVGVIVLSAMLCVCACYLLEWRLKIPESRKELVETGNYVIAPRNIIF